MAPVPSTTKVPARLEALLNCSAQGRLIVSIDWLLKSPLSTGYLLLWQLLLLLLPPCSAPLAAKRDGASASLPLKSKVTSSFRRLGVSDPEIPLPPPPDKRADRSAGILWIPLG